MLTSCRIGLIDLVNQVNGCSVLKRCLSVDSQFESYVPPVRVFNKERYKYFIDRLRLTVSGGEGGNGLPRYGGIGGSGGNVFVEAVKNMTLKMVMNNNKKISANSGEHCTTYRILGKKGNDCTIKVPTGVTIISEDGSVLGDLNKVGDKILVAFGGKGGDQSSNFCGKKGHKQTITLDLKLIADAGFVGFPNAGKSTLLKAISRATPKIASYPFTTLNPNIGILEFDDYRQISVADLPGLIEGAHLNIGLGHKFLKHIVRTKLLVFVVDINGFKYRPDFPKRTPIETCLLLNRELELFDDLLLSKPSILVVTKIDDDQKKILFDKFVDELQSLIATGIHAIDDENLRPNNLIKFDEIIAVGAKRAFNVDRVRKCIRDVIDLNVDIEKKENSQLISYSDILMNQRRKQNEDETALM